MTASPPPTVPPFVRALHEVREILERARMTGDRRDAAGRRLLRRMLAAGLSRYESDPLAALAQAGKAGA